ncbi:hypothetical protein SLE2022_321710 [Rubroshorea leprosula]
MSHSRNLPSARIHSILGPEEISWKCKAGKQQRRKESKMVKISVNRERRLTAPKLGCGAILPPALSNCSYLNVREQFWVSSQLQHRQNIQAPRRTTITVTMEEHIQFSFSSAILL